ncbi:hypothetical protein [uncultured Ruminococcus sp.]|uniref:hypothetical protein n=1 Tax=uncultured Ruminococcus sp. TaxID=165186 RepID=UPI00260F0794|nr:hypothetical protein [uncultured Ruminococcus sp.]
MERTLAAFSAIVLLVGCCTGCGSAEKRRMPKLPAIVFLYQISGEDISVRQFCDSSGDYYDVVSDDVKHLSVAELSERYEAGGLENDIMLLRSCDRAELEEEYLRLEAAAKSGSTSLAVREELPAVEAPCYSWSGICYDEKGEPVTVGLHENRCMTDIRSENSEINGVYTWFSGNLQG